MVYYPKESIYTSELLDLGNGYILVRTQDDSFVNICSGRLPVHIKPCSFCIMKLPCGCAGSFYIPPTLRHCPRHSDVTQYHTVNLLYAYQFFNWALLHDVTPHTLRKFEWNWKLPNLNMNHKRFTNLIAQVRKMAYNLKKTSALINLDIIL